MQSILHHLHVISDWCKTHDKVRYRNNGFLEQVCVCGTDAALRAWHGTRPARANSVSYVIVDRLDCAVKAKINLRCTFATSGGVHDDALT